MICIDYGTNILMAFLVLILNSYICGMKRERILRMLRRIGQNLGVAPTSAILFGSQARGDSHAGSDWDLLLVVERESPVTIVERGKLTYPFYELGMHLGIDINPVVYSRKEWEKRSFTPFYKNVKSDGIVIWG